MRESLNSEDIECIFHCIVQGGQEVTMSLNIPCGKNHSASSGSVCVLSCLKQPDASPCSV
jgi:hypothetical protein